MFALCSHSDPAQHQPHALHGPGAAWPQVNCSIDHWIEVLSVCGREPAAVAGVAFAADCGGDHWEMLEFEGADLRTVLGVRKRELAPWRPTLEHVVDHLALEQLLSVETDSWWLPDTRGTAYRAEHVKTSIIPLEVDGAARTMTYLHNEGLYALSGEDFDGVFSTDPERTHVLLPYIDLIQFGDLPADWIELAVAASRRHLAQRPADNPVRRLEEGMLPSAEMVLAEGEQTFHEWSFVTCRQLGGTAQIAAGHLRWLASVGAVGSVDAAVEAFDAVAQDAVSVQFKLARAALRKRLPAEGLLATAAEQWERAIAGAERALA